MKAEPSLLADALARYRRAKRDESMVRKLWTEAGRPVVLQHSNKTTGLHPLFRAFVGAALEYRGNARARARSRESLVER